MRRINSYRLTGVIDAAGALVVSTSADQSAPRGRVIAVEVDYPAGTVALTLTSKNLAVTQTIMNLSAANTDAIYYPRVPVCLNTGAETIYYSTTAKVYEPYMVFGHLTMTAASGTAAQVVSMIVYVEEY